MQTHGSKTELMLQFIRLIWRLLMTSLIVLYRAIKLVVSNLKVLVITLKIYLTFMLAGWEVRDWKQRGDVLIVTHRKRKGTRA